MSLLEALLREPLSVLNLSNSIVSEECEASKLEYRYQVSLRKVVHYFGIWFMLSMLYLTANCSIHLR